MKLSNAGYELIKQFEGVRTKAYQDSVGIWTIGIGFIRISGRPVVKDQVMTLDQIKQEFSIQVIPYENAVGSLIKKPLTQHQFDALVSFTYNVGVTAFRNSTLLKKINVNPNDPTVSSEFERWAKAGGKVVAGLLNRRKAEAKYYFSK